MVLARVVGAMGPRRPARHQQVAQGPSMQI